MAAVAEHGTGEGGAAERGAGGLGLEAALLRAQEDVRYPVGVVLPLGVLRAVDFLELPGHARQVEELSRSNHTHFRRVRADGDAFYRALCFAWLEVLSDRAARGRALVLPLRGGWPDAELFGELAVMYVELREQVMKLAGEPQLGQGLMTRLLVDYRFDLCAVAFVRLLVAAFWRERVAHRGGAPVEAWAAEAWADEVARHGGVEEFVRTQVLPMGCEAQGASIAAAAAQLGVHLSIVQLDGSPSTPAELAYPPWDSDGSPPGIRVRLLQRSGKRYEVAYRREASCFTEPETLTAHCSACRRTAPLAGRGLLGCCHRLCQWCTSVESECSVCLEDEMEKTALSTLELAQGCLPVNEPESPDPKLFARISPRKFNTEPTEEVIGLLRSLGTQLADEGSPAGIASNTDKTRMQDKLAKRRALIEGDDPEKGGSSSPTTPQQDGQQDGRALRPSRKSRIQCTELTKALDRACAELQKLTLTSGRSQEELAQCSAARRDAQIEAFSLKAELRAEETEVMDLSKECKRSELAHGGVIEELREQHGQHALAWQEAQANTEQRCVQWEQEQQQLHEHLSFRCAEVGSELFASEAASTLEREKLLRRIEHSEWALHVEEGVLQAKREELDEMVALKQQWQEEQRRLQQQLSDFSSALQASEASAAAGGLAQRQADELAGRLANSEAEVVRLRGREEREELEVRRLGSLEQQLARAASQAEEELQAKAAEALRWEARSMKHKAHADKLQEEAACNVAEFKVFRGRMDNMVEAFHQAEEAHQAAQGSLELLCADSHAQVNCLRAELTSTEDTVQQLARACERQEEVSAGLVAALEERDARHEQALQAERERGSSLEARWGEERKQLLQRYRREEQDRALALAGNGERELLLARLEECTASLHGEEQTLQASRADQAALVARCLAVVRKSEGEVANWEQNCARHGGRVRQLEKAARWAVSERHVLAQRLELEGMALRAAEGARKAAESRLQEAAAAAAPQSNSSISSISLAGPEPAPQAAAAGALQSSCNRGPSAGPEPPAQAAAGGALQSSCSRCPSAGPEPPVQASATAAPQSSGSSGSSARSEPPPQAVVAAALCSSSSSSSPARQDPSPQDGSAGAAIAARSSSRSPGSRSAWQSPKRWLPVAMLAALGAWVATGMPPVLPWTSPQLEPGAAPRHATPPSPQPASQPAPWPSPQPAPQPPPPPAPQPLVPRPETLGPRPSSPRPEPLPSAPPVPTPSPESPFPAPSPAPRPAPTPRHAPPASQPAPQPSPGPAPQPSAAPAPESRPSSPQPEPLPTVPPMPTPMPTPEFPSPAPPLAPRPAPVPLHEPNEPQPPSQPAPQPSPRPAVQPPHPSAPRPPATQATPLAPRPEPSPRAPPIPTPSPESPLPAPSPAPRPAPATQHEPWPAEEEARKLRREVETQRLRREAAAKAAAGAQLRAASSRSSANSARIRLAAAEKELQEARHRAATARRRIAEVEAGANHGRAAARRHTSVTWQQQLLVGIVGLSGALAILGPDTYLEGFKALTGSTLGGLMVGSCATAFTALPEKSSSGPALLDAACSLANGDGLAAGYALWAIALALGLLRWLTGFECSIYAHVDEVLVTPEGVVAVQPGDDLRRLGQRPTVCLPMRLLRPSWL